MAAAQSPTSLPAIRTQAELRASLQTLNPRINKLISDDAGLADPARRKVIAAEAVPLIKQFKADYSELVAMTPQMERQASSLRIQLDESLAILDDPEGIQSLRRMVASSDPSLSLAGQSAQFMVRWTTGGKDESVQTQTVDEIEKLDRAHPDDKSLTFATAAMSRTAATPAIADRLYKVATEVMSNPAVAQIKMQREEAEATRKLMQSVDKPFVLAAKTVNGTAFTTQDWMGKVVLVDFWATWCGPCIAELPTLHKFYDANHAKGFEVIGVSNDYAPDALRSFVEKSNIPWPQLFDPTAAASQHWNPITLGYGITGIPHMFVIDKKGILRSADARETYSELVTRLLAE